LLNVFIRIFFRNFGISRGAIFRAHRLGQVKSTKLIGSVVDG
jgi:hypothetical protein